MSTPYFKNPGIVPLGIMTFVCGICGQSHPLEQKQVLKVEGYVWESCGACLYAQLQRSDARYYNVRTALQIARSALVSPISSRDIDGIIGLIDSALAD